MNEAILVELKKMNEFLERIDWKLWNLHKKYVEGSAVEGTVVPRPAAQSSEEQFDLDIKPVAKTLTPVKEQPVQDGIPVSAIPKYPSVEKV